MSGLEKYYTESQKKIIDDVIKECGGEATSFEVACIDINTILSILPSNQIDLLSIDTEGSEKTILQAIDYDKFLINTIVVEVINGDSGLTDFLNSKGYRKVKEVGYDWVYTK